MIATSALPRRALAGQFLFGMLWLGITIVGLVLRPEAAGHGTHEQLGLPPCPSALFFDRPCPGCGLTTSFVALLHGNIPLAFHAHLLGPLLYLVLAWTGISSLVLWTRGERFDVTTRSWMTGIVAGAVIFIGFGVWRMIVTDHYRSPAETVALHSVG